MPKILITGAAGFIGMHTSIRFLKEGWDVIGLDNLNNYYSVQLKKDRIFEIEKIARDINYNFKFYENDINSDIWQELVGVNIDAVIHLAAQAGVRYSLENPMSYLSSNILGFQKILEFVHKNNIGQFLYASSSSVYGKDSELPFNESSSCNSPESYYAATKKMNELMAYAYYKSHDVRSIGMRFFTVYGPWGRPDMAPYIFIDAAFNKKPIKVFNYGNQVRDFTYIDDIVEGVYQLFMSKQVSPGAHIYNIGNGTPVKLYDFITCMEKHTGQNIEKEFVESQKGDVSFTNASIEKLTTLTGFSPRTNIDDGLRKFVNWYIDYNL